MRLTRTGQPEARVDVLCSEFGAADNLNGQTVIITVDLKFGSGRRMELEGSCPVGLAIWLLSPDGYSRLSDGQTSKQVS